MMLLVSNVLISCKFGYVVCLQALSSMLYDTPHSVVGELIAAEPRLLQVGQVSVSASTTANVTHSRPTSHLGPRRGKVKTHSN